MKSRNEPPSFDWGKAKFSILLTNATKLRYNILMGYRIIENLLKEKGYRLTIIRKALIRLFSRKEFPLAVVDILNFLKKQNFFPNKTTIYRELEFLKKQKIILELQLGEDKKRYEIAYGNHHHHLICVRCENIQDVEVYQELKEEEKYIEQNKQFKVLNHSLEFFGLCQRCQ